MSCKAYIILIMIPLVTLAAVQETCTAVTDEYPDPVLFVHGMGGASTNFNSLKSLFRGSGWPDDHLFAYSFPDPLNCSEEELVDNAHLIEQWVTNILSTTGSQKVDIVAHSMGGMSSRYYLKFLNGTDHVDDYVSLGSPDHGRIPLTAVQVPCCYSSNTSSTFVLQLNEGDETPGGYLMDEVGERYDSIMDVTYNGTHVPGDINYTAIYSRDDAVVTPYNTSRLEGANNMALDGYTHVEIASTAPVFEYIKQAVNDGKTYTTTITTTVFTTTTASTATAGIAMVPAMVALAAAMMSGRGRKRD